MLQFLPAQNQNILLTKTHTLLTFDMSSTIIHIAMHLFLGIRVQILELRKEKR